MVLQELAALDREIIAKSAIVRAVEWVAKHLGNTAAVCRKCYIHPAIFEGYLDGTLLRTLANKTQAYLRRNIAGMSAEEAPVVAFLRLRLTKLAVEEANAGSTRRRSGAKTARRANGQDQLQEGPLQERKRPRKTHRLPPALSENP
jgi:DNA topoisomerase-1